MVAGVNVPISPIMKFFKKSSATSFRFSQNPDGRTKFTSLNLLFLAIAAGLMLAAGPAQCQTNLLQNPGFEVNSGNAVPTSWTFFAPPSTTAKDYWIVTSTDGCAPHLAPHSGSLLWKEWWPITSANNVAGIYQTLGCAPGSIFQASGWIATKGCDTLGPDDSAWIQVEFLDVNTNLLALYKSANFSSTVGTDIWLQYQATNACDLTQPVATGDPYFTTYMETGSVSQLVAPFGTAAVRYRYCLLYVATNIAGSADFDDADLNQLSGPVPPVISSLFPQNMIFVNPSSNTSFNVSSPSGFTINNSGIHVTVNGTDVSGSLAISGSAASKNVVYSGLQSNLTYTVSISATDVSNLTVTASTTFQTMWYGIQPVTYLWEAEDWDFNSGMYIDNPDLCSASGDPDCYFGKVGVQGVDENFVDANNPGGDPSPYRPGDPMGTAPSGDYFRPNLFEAGVIDYRIDPFNYSAWVNYTRDWPNSTNWIIARVSANLGQSGSLTLSVVTPAATNDLGTFSVASALGFSTYINVYLQDTNGHTANVVLNGKETLRVTSYPGANLLPNFFMLVAAQVDLPGLTTMYPTGTRPFEYTNALSFTVTTLGSTFPAGGIKVNLDGIDVSSNLVITGSASTANVVYPGLQVNAPHVAIITVTNALGHGFSVTNQFDTFTQNNFMFEAEDFDYGGGQYISPVNWQPDAYEGLDGTANIDFFHTTVAGELYPYRNGIPQSLVQNYTVEARQEFINAGGQDYQLDWFGIGDWANYTDVYPTGGFFVYVRTAGLNGIPFSMYLSQVVSGAGTTNQVFKPARPVEWRRNQPTNLRLGAIDRWRRGCAGGGKVWRREHPCSSPPPPATAIQIISCWSRHPASTCRRSGWAVMLAFLSRPRWVPQTGSSTGLI